MHFKDLVFPVFVLRQYDNIETIKGVRIINTFFGKYILDDTTLYGQTYLDRRTYLAIHKEEYTLPLYKVKGALYDIKGLINYFLITKAKFGLIDNHGRVYESKKTQFGKLKSIKTSNIVVLEGNYRVTVSGKPFITKYTPKKYARMLILENGSMFLVDFSDEYEKDRRIKI